MQTVKINPANTKSARASVLVVYTGGTFGMVYDAKNKQLVTFDFSQILDLMPEMARLDIEITFVSLPVVIDSSNMNPVIWGQIAQIIYENYALYDGFVILHGTDTMAYTASALSYMLQNLGKSVILTGAQLPIGVARTDARENLMTSLELAAEQHNDLCAIPEVAIYFNAQLLRGNRTKKKESSQLNAFRSENYPVLAEAGVTIEFNWPYIKRYISSSSFTINTNFDTRVAILKIFPGINQTVVRALLNAPDLRGVILETFGAGNAPTDPWFLEEIRLAIERRLVLFNVSQCDGGRVSQGFYQTSRYLGEVGVVSGGDITVEAAITKLMFCLGQSLDNEVVKLKLSQPIAGEMSV